MQVKYGMRQNYIALLIATMAIFPLAADGSPTNQGKKIFLTRIDATNAAGLRLTLSGNALELYDLSGDRAKSFPIDQATASVRPSLTEKSVVVSRRRRYISAAQTWKITDDSGAGVEVIDNTVRTLVIVSQVNHLLTLVSSKQTTQIPGHSIVILNSPAKDAILDYGSSGWLGFNGHYREKMWPVNQPTEVIVAPNGSGITGGFPVITESTRCDQTSTLSGS